MATTPRYLATTASGAVTYLEAALDGETFLVVFDSDRDGSVAAASTDETELARAVCRAETTVDEMLGASHGAPWSADTFAALAEGVRDSVKECVLGLCLYERVRFRTAMGDEKKTPFRTLWKDTKERLKQIAEDNKGRLGGSAVPEPTATAGGVVVPDTDTSSPWTLAASGDSPVGF